MMKGKDPGVHLMRTHPKLIKMHQGWIKQKALDELQKGFR